MMIVTSSKFPTSGLGIAFSNRKLPREMVACNAPITSLWMRPQISSGC